MTRVFTGLIFGYFDYAFLLIFLAANYWVFRRQGPLKHPVLLSLGLLLAYGVLLPIISMGCEIHWPIMDRRVPAIDAFELLYTYFRFPLYWAFGLLQLGLFVVRLTVNSARTAS